MSVDAELGRLSEPSGRQRAAVYGARRPLVMCVDDAVAVYKEAMAMAGQTEGTTAFADPGEVDAPEG